MAPKKQHHIETLLLHGAYSPDAATGATVMPLHQSTAFAYKTAEDIESVFAGKDAGFIYSRINNPTLDMFERKLKTLEDGLAAISVSSGMAAISTTALALAGPGDEIIAGKSVFGGTYSLFSATLKRYGITTKFVDTCNVEAYSEAVSDRTKMIFVETLSNPKTDVPDIAAISAIARKHGIVLVVDNTVTTPLLLQAKTLGADIVVHSTSKYINGHGNSVGGIIIDSGTFDWSNPRYEHLEPFYKKARHFAFLAYLRNQVYRDLGCCLSPFNAFLMSIGIESLGVRMERHCSNGMAVARYLANSDKVHNVRYPGLESHSGNKTAVKQFKNGFGALMSISLGTKERCFKFINGLVLAQNLANIGDVRTLVIHPGSTICRDGTEAERAAMGATDDIVRLCIGLENIDDIIADLEASLAGI